MEAGRTREPRCLRIIAPLRNQVYARSAAFRRGVSLNRDSRIGHSRHRSPYKQHPRRRGGVTGPVIVITLEFRLESVHGTLPHHGFGSETSLCDEARFL